MKIENDTLEKVLLKPMYEAEKRHTNEFVVATIIGVSMICEKHVEPFYEEVKKKAWIVEALEIRLNNFLDISLDKKTIATIALLNEGIIGRAIMYLYYIQYWGKRKGIQELNFDIVFKEVFRGFIFSDVQIRDFWEAQKLGGDNLIDISEASKSILFSYK